MSDDKKNPPQPAVSQRFAAIEMAAAKATELIRARVAAAEEAAKNSERDS